LKTVKKTTATLTLMISAIAVISLVVGGIGVMNIMLVSVTERTHEIGIRMAVAPAGAISCSSSSSKAVLVCLVGGLLGILFAFGVSEIFSMFVTAIAMKFSGTSILAAFLCSSLIGVLFGFCRPQGRQTRSHRSPGPGVKTMAASRRYPLPCAIVLLLLICLCGACGLPPRSAYQTPEAKTAGTMAKPGRHRHRRRQSDTMVEKLPRSPIGRTDRPGFADQ
jgi:hypothetical protein